MSNTGTVNTLLLLLEVWCEIQFNDFNKEFVFIWLAQSLSAENM
jgi:hypothetical protein